MNIEDLPTIEEDDYTVWSADDWLQVFPWIEREGYYEGHDYSGTTAAGDLTGKPIEDMTAERIASFVHIWAESPEGGGSVNFACIVRLTDDAWAVSEAWADYTGWGCQANAWWKVGPTYESVMAELSQSNRDRFAVTS